MNELDEIDEIDALPVGVIKLEYFVQDSDGAIKKISKPSESKNESVVCHHLGESIRVFDKLALTNTTYFNVIKTIVYYEKT